jgi:hypothetical protein
LRTSASTRGLIRRRRHSHKAVLLRHLKILLLVHVFIRNGGHGQCTTLALHLEEETRQQTKGPSKKDKIGK